MRSAYACDQVLLLAVAYAGFSRRPDGSPLRRFDYSSKIWYTFAAAAGQDMHSFAFCDIGAGDGTVGRDAAAEMGLAGLIRQYDVVPRGKDVRRFDGMHIPEANHSFDVVSFLFVLHHAAAKTPTLLREAARVTREWVLVAEDVSRPGDAVAERVNRAHDKHGIFRTHEEWSALFAQAGLEIIAFGPVFDYGALQRFYVMRRISKPNPCRPHCYRNPNTPRLVLNGTSSLPAGANIWGLPTDAKREGDAR